MHGGTRSGAGRRAVHIDLVQLEKLSALQCTDQELAAWFGVSPYTIAKRRKKPEFAEAIERGRGRGLISVRRAQLKLLASGNPTIAVWLGRQLLGQRDVITNEHTGAAGQLRRRRTAPAATVTGRGRHPETPLVEVLPRDAGEVSEVIQSWDCAFKDTASSDYVVGQVWGRLGADKYLLDQVRRRMDCPGTVQAVRQLS